VVLVITTAHLLTLEIGRSLLLYLLLGRCFVVGLIGFCLGPLDTKTFWKRTIHLDNINNNTIKEEEEEDREGKKSWKYESCVSFVVH